MAHKKKRGKAVAPTHVDQVHRSNCLAGLTAGFKDKPPSGLLITEGEEGSIKNLAPEFEAFVVDSSAHAPPFLPIPTLQAIGTGQCQISSKMLSEEDLNYDSTNDSVENN